MSQRNKLVPWLRQVRSVFTKKGEHQIGIALGGGGARGFLHLGVLQALYEYDMKPDVIAGTSAGAIVGSLIAAGKTPHTVHELLKEKNMFAYTRIQWSLKGLFSLEGLRDTLKKEIVQENIEQLPTPFIATVTNMNKGRAEYLASGPIHEAVIASSSIPFIFKPVHMNNCLYADGGILDNMPVKPLMPMCKYIIGVSISPIHETNDLNSIVKIAGRTFQLSVNAQTRQLKTMCTVFIEPAEMVNYDLFDMKRADDLFYLGYNTTKKLNLQKIIHK